MIPSLNLINIILIKDVFLFFIEKCNSRLPKKHRKVNIGFLRPLYVTFSVYVFEIREVA